MWVVLLGQHFIYIEEKESRFETRHYFLALLVYWAYFVRYLFSIYPEKYVKIYKVENDVIQLKNYKLDYQGRKRNESSRRKRSSKAPRKI